MIHLRSAFFGRSVFSVWRNGSGLAGWCVGPVPLRGDGYGAYESAADQDVSTDGGQGGDAGGYMGDGGFVRVS